MNWLQIDPELEKGLERAIAALDAAYKSRRGHLEKALALVREDNQFELLAPTDVTPAEVSNDRNETNGTNVIDRDHSAARTNVEVVEAVLGRLPGTFDFHDVMRVIATSFPARPLARRQVNGAFMKIVKRKGSPFEVFREGSGNIPTVYRRSAKGS